MPAPVSVTPVLSLITPDNGASASDFITDVGAVTLTGTAGANAAVTVAGSAITYGTTTADASGHWSLAVTFAEGSYQVHVSGKDNPGSTVSTSNDYAINIDLTAPVAPTLAASNAGGAVATAPPSMAAT